MAIYGIGAYYSDTDDVSADFLKRGFACVGWDYDDAPSLHKILKFIKTGDLIYIKSHPPGKSLFIKAVGIVKNDNILSDKKLGACLPIEWIWEGWEELTENDRYNVRNNTLYEEVNPDIQAKVIQLLLSKINNK